MRVTIDLMFSKHPCATYGRERIAELWAGRESLTLVDICDLDIPIPDRIWAATRFLPHRENRLFACDCAEKVAHLHPIVAPTLEVARRHADGLATDEELSAAEAAAEDAAEDAAEAAARDAEWAAAAAEWTAAAAAWAAAWAAARAAAAAEAAAWDAARETQIAMLRARCEKLEAEACD